MVRIPFKSEQGTKGPSSYESRGACPSEAMSRALPGHSDFRGA